MRSFFSDLAEPDVPEVVAQEQVPDEVIAIQTQGIERVVDIPH